MTDNVSHNHILNQTWYLKNYLAAVIQFHVILNDFDIKLDPACIPGCFIVNS